VLLKETYAMTAPSSIDPARFLHEQLASASPDLLRSMLTTFVNTLMSAEVDVVCGACYRRSSPERVNVRNGYRHREFDTRVGTLDVAIPKLREGSMTTGWRPAICWVCRLGGWNAWSTRSGSPSYRGHRSA
jgi:hypothetical protein